jgi:hypothetical protein
VPFDFLRRGGRTKDQAAAGNEASAAGGERPAIRVPFDGLTPEWRLRGTFVTHGRLSDALNRREEVELADVDWAPADGSGPFEKAPGIKVLDPYDLVLIVAGPDTLPVMTDDERQAHKVHKIPFDVSLEAPPFRVIGTVMLHPGSDPSQLQDRSMPMFIPVVNAVAFLERREISNETPGSAILVNRFYVRSVAQADRDMSLRLARAAAAQGPRLRPDMEIEPGSEALRAALGSDPDAGRFLPPEEPTKKR